MTLYSTRLYSSSQLETELIPLNSRTRGHARQFQHIFATNLYYNHSYISQSHGFTLQEMLLILKYIYIAVATAVASYIITLMKYSYSYIACGIEFIYIFTIAIYNIVTARRNGCQINNQSINQSITDSPRAHKYRYSYIIAYRRCYSY